MNLYSGYLCYADTSEGPVGVQEVTSINTSKNRVLFLISITL